MHAVRFFFIYDIEIKIELNQLFNWFNINRQIVGLVGFMVFNATFNRQIEVQLFWLKSNVNHFMLH